MRDLAVAILGTEDSTYNNASDLLDDYFPDDTVVYLPSYISSDQTGLRRTFDWLKDADINYERVKKSQLLDSLTATSANKFAVIVIGVDDSEDIILSAMSQGIPVFDLTRGLYSVTAADIALRGSETDANGQTRPELSQDTLEDSKPLERSTDTRGLLWEDQTFLLAKIQTRPVSGEVYRVFGENDELLYVGKTTLSLETRLRSHFSPNAKPEAPGRSGQIGIENLSKVRRIESVRVGIDQLDKIELSLIHDSHPPLNRSCKRGCNFYREERLMRAHMEIGESGWEPTPAEILDAADILIAEEHFAQTKEVIDEAKTKYYKSARGKLRKAGKSKARPGETEVWLTDEEASEN